MKKGINSSAKIYTSKFDIKWLQAETDLLRVENEQERRQGHRLTFPGTKESLSNL